MSFLDELILFSIEKGSYSENDPMARPNVYRLRKFLRDTFGYDLSFGTLFPHVDKMIVGGIISRDEQDVLSVTPRGRIKCRSLLDELFLIQSKLAPETFSLELKLLADRVTQLEELKLADRIDKPRRIPAATTRGIESAVKTATSTDKRAT